jgi:hypothetical protein
MAEQAGEFFGNWQALARESWDAWLRKTQSSSAAGAPFGSSPATGSDDVFARSMAGLKTYMEWMQGAAMAGTASPAPAPDWSQSMRQMFEGAMGGGQPFSHAFGSAGTAIPGGFTPPWQALWEATRQGMPGAEPVAAFGHTREQQLQQQALAAAMVDYLETIARYRALIERAHAQGMERMQEKLAQLAAAGHPAETMKAMYDTWVDAAEDAYAEVALSDEFREVFGAMSNAQMRLRQLQQQQIEQWCRELGMPTRSEVASLGQRLQEIRREWRASRPEKAAASDSSLSALQAEVAGLKRRIDVIEGKRKPAAATKVAKSPKTANVTSGKRKTAPAKSAARAPVSRKSKK